MRIRNMTLCGLFAALLAVCAWLCVPVADTVLTLQTFGIALCLGVLGGRWGSVAIGVYLLLGAVGLPVFSGFRGGFGMLFSTTGGYLTGFFFFGLMYWLITTLFPNGQLLGMAAGLLICYCFGSVWYYHVYTAGGDSVTFGFILIKCVLPYLLPDAVKLLLAWQLSKKLRRFVY